MHKSRHDRKLILIRLSKAGKPWSRACRRGQHQEFKIGNAEIFRRFRKSQRAPRDSRRETNTKEISRDHLPRQREGLVFRSPIGTMLRQGNHPVAHMIANGATGDARCRSPAARRLARRLGALANFAPQEDRPKPRGRAREGVPQDRRPKASADAGCDRRRRTE